MPAAHVFFVGTELDVLEETSVQMVAPQAVDVFGLESHEEVSHSDEDVPEVSLLGSNTSLHTYACAVKIRADRYHGEMSFQLERKDGTEICSFSINQLSNSGLRHSTRCRSFAIVPDGKSSL